MVENGITGLDGLPWFPPPQRDLDPTEERLVPHVRDVTQGALAETLTERRDLNSRSTPSSPGISPRHPRERPPTSSRDTSVS